MNTPYFIYEIDQRKKLNTLGNFENQPPTHIDATHAFIPIFNPGIQPNYVDDFRLLVTFRICHQHLKSVVNTENLSSTFRTLDPSLEIQSKPACNVLQKPK